MEKINIRECFPVMNGGDGVLLSKRGDITIGWQISLPPAYSCNEEDYDKIIQSIHSAVKLLPDWAIVHKQDIYMYDRYSAGIAETFLEEQYEKHFRGRKYLNHECRLWLTFSNKSNVRGATSGIMGISSGKLPNSAAITRVMEAAQQFVSMVESSGLIRFTPLSEEDIFGTDDIAGVILDYLNFTSHGSCTMSHIEVQPEYICTNNKKIGSCLIADLDQLPQEVTSYRKVLDNDISIMLSPMSCVGYELDCEHIVNQFIVNEPAQEIIGALDTKRRKMQSMSARSAENRMYSEEIKEYLDDTAATSRRTIKAHYNIIVGGPDAIYQTNKNKVTTALSKAGITPVWNNYDTPCQFWASIPGNAAGLQYSEYFTMDLYGALCLCNYDGHQMGFASGNMKMCDRINNIPCYTDIQEKAFDEGLIENYNVFLLGPSGSGKSFFVNKYLRSCYVAGQHCFLIDVGDSYRGLCNIIAEESNGADGVYYTFEKGKPLSFNPFRCVSRFKDRDNRALDFLFTLMCTLWKNGSETIKPVELRFIKASVISFIDSWTGSADPVFNDYYSYLKKSYVSVLDSEGIEKEYFDIKSYLLALEQFFSGGTYDYLLNSPESVDILNNRFVVFEIDAVKDDKIIYPITTLVIMDAFMEKMASNGDFKVMCIEEAWKALMGTQMAEYMMELYKTARKHRTSAMVVSQELKDITSSPIVKDTIIENSAVKILLDQSKYSNKMDVLAENLSLNEKDIALVLSLNKLNHSEYKGRDVFFNLGNRKSFVMRLEVSAAETIAFSSQKRDKKRLADEVKKTKSYIKAIANIIGESKEV